MAYSCGWIVKLFIKLFQIINEKIVNYSQIIKKKITLIR